jgi:hypothetical protein
VLQKDIHNMRLENRQMAEDIKLVAVPSALKIWLKARRFRPIEDFENMFF